DGRDCAYSNCCPGSSPVKVFVGFQVALRRQQAQEEALGICSPVAVNGPEVMVKSEPGADCLLPVDGRSMPSTISTFTYVHAAIPGVCSCYKQFMIVLGLICNLRMQ
uniref:Uncharacterized protein n=1 Tax=Cynoglossus semilaevis TaxID=244447 RepID=A0A3P8WHS2_CYNSE